jgi:hypothetical protein
MRRQVRGVVLAAAVASGAVMMLGTSAAKRRLRFLRDCKPGIMVLARTFGARPSTAMRVLRRPYGQQATDRHQRGTRGRSSLRIR